MYKWTIDDKLALKAILLERLWAKHNELKKSAKSAHSGATHEDAQAKSKYDTHGLELSYFAGSQYERAALLKSEILKLESLHLTLIETNAEIELGSLVALRFRTEKAYRYYFLCAQGAGELLEYKGLKICVLSPNSPMGEELLNSIAGDELEINGRQLSISEIY